MPELQKDDMSFLSRSFERHFNERPYLKHSCYLYLTKTTSFGSIQGKVATVSVVSVWPNPSIRARPLAERFGNFDAAAARQVIGRDGP